MVVRMMKKIYLIVILLLCALSVGLGIQCGIVPDLYLYLLILGYVILFVGTCFFLKRIKKIFIGIGLILSIFLIAIASCSSFLFVKADQFFNSITNVEYEVSNYSVIVLNSSKYKELEDIMNQDVGVVHYNDNYENALSKLKNKIDIQTRDYDNIFYSVNDLLNEKIDVIFLNESYISILNESIHSFEDKIRVLDVISIEEEKVVKTESVSNSEKNSFNVYISGIDTYGSIHTVSRSDVNIITTVNIYESKVLLTTIPRDMYVPLAGTTGLKDKLTHSGIYGVDTSIGTIENFLDIKIDYYVRINFNTLISLVDYLGGIDVYSDYDFDAGNRHYTKGMNYNLSGKEALAFSRNRYAFSDGDRQRGRNQEKVIEAIINKVTSSRDINTYLNLVSTLENSFQTNMSKELIHKFIKMQLENNYHWNIESIDVNGYDHMDYTYSCPWQKLYVMLVDDDSLNEAKEKIKDTLE